MAAPDYDKLTGVARDLLDSAAACLVAPPSRTFLSAGEPAADCPLLAVHCAGIRTVTLDQPTDRPAPRPEPKSKVASFVVTVWANICGKPEPSPVDLDDDGANHLDVGWQLFAGLSWRAATGALLPSYTEPSSLTRATNVTLAEKLDPAGAMAGWTVTVEIML